MQHRVRRAALEGKEDPDGHNLTRPESRLPMLGKRAHLLVYLAEEGNDKVFGRHGSLLPSVVGGLEGWNGHRDDRN